MNTSFTIPEGFELKQTGLNHFEIVPKANIQINNNDYVMPGNYNEIEQQERMNAVEQRWEQLQCCDYENNQQDKIDRLFPGNVLHEMYKSGKIGLSREERKLLERCHNMDMKKFLKEEVKDKPIKLEGNADGDFWLADRY